MRLTAAFIAAGCLVPVAAQSLPPARRACPEVRTITVTGHGTATAEADLAIIHVGYQTYGPNEQSAYNAAADRSSAVMNALTGVGVAKADIESTGQALTRTQPYQLQQYPIDSEERINHTFTVVQGWIVQATPDESAKILNAAIRAGANYSGWIDWKMKDETQLQTQAAAAAADNAWALADLLATKMKVHITHLEYLSQLEGVMNPWGSDQPGLVGGNAGFSVMGPDNRQLAIHARKVEVQANLQATFAVE